MTPDPLMFQATRRRLALWYAALTALLLVIAASGFYGYARTTLIERVDDTLNHVAEVVVRSLVVESVQMRDLADPANVHLGQMPPWDLEHPGDRPFTRQRVNLEASFRDPPPEMARDRALNLRRNPDPNGGSVWNNVEDDRIDLEWFSPSGELLWTTFARATGVPLHPHNRQGETVRLEVDPAAPPVMGAALVLRQIVQPVERDRALLGYLRVSHPWFEVTRPTQQLAVDLGVAIAAGVAAVGGVSWFLSGLAIAPVRDAYQRLRQFTADASHELRNPIATIQTNVQVALADPEPHMQAEQLRTIERLTRRLGRLVDDLLFLARQDSGSLVPRNQWVDLAQLLQSMIDEQQVIAHQQGIALTLAIAADLTNQPDASAHPSPNSKTHPSPDSSPDPSTSTHSSTHSSAPLGGNPRPDPPKTEPTSISPSRIWGDRDRLTRLLLNPIANALQHTPPGGQVTVTLSRLDTPRRAPATLQIAITDTGSGIPADALPHLFDRFYRVDRARTRTASATGSGLGLAIAHSIATSYRGAIAISSTLHQGTQVHITLPQLPSTETSPPHA